ncbi:hypothetical protein EMCRGX_G029936 [Ephydatia muelleri]
MFRQRAAEVACFAFIAAVGVQLVASQTLTCYNSSTTCTSTSVRLTGTRPAGQCCLNRGGRSYRASLSTACTPCAIYGFFQSPNSIAPSTTVYQKEGSQLTVYFGFVNGTFSGTHSVSFSVPDNNRYIKSFTTGSLSSAATRQQFTLSIIPDNIALQPPLSVAVSALVDGSSELVLPFNAVILDADVVTIGFRESEYTVTEGASPPDQYARVKLAKDKTIAQPLSVQVVPLTVDQFRPLGIPLPDGITFADLFNPAQYIPNGPMDFDKSILNLTFTSSQREINFNVAIVDDLINEADQQFICIVRLTNPSVNASGNVIIKNPSTVITIADDDLISIGFGADTYTFTKGQQIYYDDTVKLVKDDGVVSEQTFSVTIIAQPNAVDNQATYNVDYDIGFATVVMFTITPDQQSISIGVNIYDAGLTGTLQAKLVSTQVANTPSYSAPHNPTTLLLILDNKVAIVGFVDRGTVVTEGGDFIECVAVTDPPPELTMQLSFYIQVLLVPDTADASDVFTSDGPIILGPFDDTNRMYCFSTTALADEYFEGNQTFTYSLTLVGEQTRVVVSPNVTMVTILDNTTLTIGFDPTQYTVNKSDSYVTFGVSILGGATIQGASVGVMFSTGDGTALAGQDYNQTAQLLSFNENTAYIPVAVGIINNGYYEDDISFQANLALQSAGGYEQFVTLSPAMATATIIDDINGVTIGFDQTGYSFLENQRYARVSVRVLQGQLKKSVAVQFRTIRGSAVGPDDYAEIDKILVFNTYTHFITVDVPLVDDGLAEDDESFSAQLLAVSPSGLVTIAPATTLITIIDTNSVIIGFEKQSYQISKHQNQGRLPVKIQVLQGTFGRTVLLHFKTRDGSAIASTNYISIDYALPAMNFSVHELTVDVSIIVNDLAEDDKHQNQGRLPVKIQVLQGILGRTVLLHVKTRDGSAIASKNYISIDSDLPALNFSVHELTVDVSIVVNGLAEEDKVFSVELSLISPSSRVTIAPRSAQVTIIDDNAIYLVPTIATYVLRAENQNQAVVCFVAAPVAALRVNVTVVALEDDVPSARSPQHFIARSVRLTIPPYTSPQTELCVAFTIIDNKVALEPNKTFSIKVMPSPKVVLLRPISHVLIVDDDVNFTSSNYTSVGSGYTAVCVSKDAATASNINVEITLTSSNASCTSGDFSPVVYSTVLVAGPAGVPTCINVTNYLWEGRSSFRMSITKVTAAEGIVKVGAPSSASMSIFNAGCLENEDTFLCHYVFGTFLCQLKVYNQLCCRTCGVIFVTIGFRESDYTVTEGASPPDQYPNLKLAKDKTIAQQLSVQVVPLTVDQFRPLGIPLPDGITFADLTNPAQYIPNGPMDFDKSILNLTFTSSQTELSPNVAIVDDLINEADQQFICIVRLADPTVFASPRQIGPLNTHPDPIAIAIGFGADTYTFTKGQQIFYADTVKLVKDDGVVSEQTFSVTVIAQPNAVDNQAMFGVDYDMGPYAVQTFTITPDQLSVSIGVDIYDAGLTGTLQAKLVSTQVANTPSYSAPHNPTTLLLILENKVAIVGFVNRGAVVTEGGDFIECVAVTDPPPELTMQLSFYIQVLLVPDTADASDVSSDAFFIGPFDNTNRMYCFSINAHEYFEGNQTFTYSLTLIGEQVPVVIYSIVTMVTILDNTTLTIGFDPTQYAVNESNSYVTLGVSILGGATIQGASVGVMFSTGDGTALAGQDYNQTAQLLTFNESTAYIPVAVGIINNGYYEDDISFQANLTLQSAGGYEQFVTLSPAMATATIIDDINGVTIGFDQIGYSFLENQRYARVSVRVLQGQLKKSVAVQFRTIRGSAVGPYDYTETEKILVFNKSTHSINVDVPLVDDGLAEDNESFLAQLLAVSPSGRVTIAPATTLITIIDTNSVIIGFEKQSYQISKHQNQGRLPVKIQVLQGTLGRTVLLHVKTRDGSAIASKNYISIDYDLPALNFSVHELTVNGSIIVNDLAEDDKVFSVELSPISPSSRVTIAPRSAQVTIIDDNAIYLVPTKATYVLRENQNQAMVCFVAAPVAALRVNVTVVAMEDDVPSARSSQHFIASSVRLTIPPYTPPQAELCVAFMILDNKVALEPNKTFSIKVMPSPKVVLLRPISHVLIVDDDAVSVNFTSSNYTSVGSGYTAVCVSKDAVTASNINVEITLTSANASCTSGDFSPVVYSTVLVAGPAGVPTCINVTNYLWEGRSSFRMSITKVTAAEGIVKVGAPSSAIV